MSHPFVAQRVFNTPLLIHPTKAHAILTGMGARFLGGRVKLPEMPGSDELDPGAAGREVRASLVGGDLAQRYSAQGRPLYGVRDGVAVIPITGTLVHRGAYIGESSGVTSYEGIRAQVQTAIKDPAVRGIALEIDSFGGEVAGAFDLADLVRSARSRKPVWAFVAEAALSAGYVLASQADRIILPRTGEVGGIGILIVHADLSQRLTDAGVAVSLIHAGVHKVDGNPFAPLPDAVRAQLQADIEGLRAIFVATVAAGRSGRLTVKAARATEGRSYRGASALQAGLVDQVTDLRSAFSQFVEIVNGRSEAVPPLGRPAGGSPGAAPSMRPTNAVSDGSGMIASSSPVPPPRPTAAAPAATVGTTPADASRGARSERRALGASRPSHRESPIVQAAKRAAAAAEVARSQRRRGYPFGRI